MENIKIKELRKNYYVVVADTKEFGEQQVIFEGISAGECLHYIDSHKD